MEDFKILKDQVETTIENLKDVLDELHSLKDEIKKNIRSKDFRQQHIIIEQRRTLVDLYRLVLDYNKESTTLREKVFNAQLKMMNLEKGDDETIGRALLDQVARKLKITQEKVDKELEEGFFPQVLDLVGPQEDNN